MARRPIALTPVSGIVVALSVVFGLGSDRDPRHARAAPPPSPSIDFVRFDGSVPVVKPKSPMPSSGPRKAPDCVARAYAQLADETFALAVVHGEGTPAFRAAYAARKGALVSQAALDAAGCKVD
jgi:hypothetical protein